MIKILILIKVIIFLLIGQDSRANDYFLGSVRGEWDRIWEMQPGIYRVLQSGRVGVINEVGEVLIPVQFDQVYDLDNEGYVRVLKDLKIGLFHLEKGMILPAEFDQIWPFDNQRARVLKNRKFGYINPDGSILIPVEYHHIWPESDGFYKVLRDGRTGLIDMHGDVVLSAEYQQIWPFQQDLARVLRDGKMGLVNRQGVEVIPPIYQQVTVSEDGTVRAILGNEILYMDNLGRMIEPEEELKVDEDERTPDQIELRPEVKPETPATGIRIGRENVHIQHDESGRRETITKSTTRSRRRHYFNGHLAGVNLGINGYLDSDFRERVPEGYEFMEPIHSKSIEFSVYPFEKSVRLIGSNVGLVTALGIEYNNYRFDLSTPADLNETALEWFPILPEGVRINKSKLTTLFLNVPVMLEFQIPDRMSNTGLYIGGGVVGGMHLRSHTKIVYRDEGSRNSRKKRGDLNIKTFRYSYIGRAGYDNIGIYATWSPVGIFREEKGPDLYPYSVGVSFNF